MFVRVSEMAANLYQFYQGACLFNFITWHCSLGNQRTGSEIELPFTETKK
jgi:hypothetical protein